MPLTDAEYEDVYAETLVCLADDGHIVSEPFYDRGIRYCVVDKHTVFDKEALELWWGEQITQEILEGRNRT